MITNYKAPFQCNPFKLQHINFQWWNYINIIFWNVAFHLTLHNMGAGAYIHNICMGIGSSRVSVLSKQVNSSVCEAEHHSFANNTYLESSGTFCGVEGGKLHSWSTAALNCFGNMSPVQTLLIYVHWDTGSSGVQKSDNQPCSVYQGLFHKCLHWRRVYPCSNACTPTQCKCWWKSVACAGRNELDSQFRCLWNSSLIMFHVYNMKVSVIPQ